MTTTTANAAAPQTEPDWGAIRREFPTLENFVYLDISKKAILPRRVEEFISEWMRDIYEEPSDKPPLDQKVAG